MFIHRYSGIQARNIRQYFIQVLRSSWLIGVEWITVVFGLIGNIALIAIFRKKDLKLRFNSLMLTLAIFDLIYLCSQITASMAIYFGADFNDKIIQNLSNIPFSLSTFTAIAISIERYCMVCRSM